MTAKVSCAQYEYFCAAESQFRFEVIHMSGLN